MLPTVSSEANSSLVSIFDLDAIIGLCPVRELGCGQLRVGECILLGGELADVIGIARSQQLAPTVQFRDLNKENIENFC